jgi:hypothetical protein
MKKFLLVLMATVLAILALYISANAQPDKLPPVYSTQPIRVGTVYWLFDDSAKQAQLFEVWTQQGCPANIYIHDTLWQIPGGYSPVRPAVDPVPYRDTIYLCPPTGQPPAVFTTIFTTQTPPTTSEVDAQGAITIGVQFKASAATYVKGVRFYKVSNNLGTHIGYLYNSTGTILDSGTFVETASGWQSVQFKKNIQLLPGATYTAAVYSASGRYSGIQGQFNTPIVNGILTATKGVYNYGNKWPTLSYNNSNYFADVITSPTF